MAIIPRHYQQAAHNAVIDHWKRSTLPVVVEAATGAGKSIIIALLAKTLHDMSGGKRVLCLAPSRELVQQNAEKYGLIGEPYSIYSASISKSLRHQVVFATEGTFKSVAKRLGKEFAGVIVDEAHGITPTIQAIISDMKESSPNLRICGLSATPFRLGTGYIYAVDEDDRALDESVCRDPYFYKCVYKITARQLVDMGFLTPLVAGTINAAQYDTGGLQVQSNGKYSQASVKAAFEGWGRKTAAIVADVVANTQDSTGTMIFASTVQHAMEVMASLHPDNSRVITGKTKKSDREQMINEFKAQKFLYLVNVSTLTTGVDCPNVSDIVILRKTESVSLLQQIMGRAMRLFGGKLVARVWDYANNLESHCPDGDLYKPEVKAAYKTGNSEPMECVCEHCLKINSFAPRDNDHGYGVDEYGYYTDVADQRVMVEAGDVKKPMPAHYGRRCQHYDLRSGERCDYYWSSKDCVVCDHKNDIAARYCRSCSAELVNPNEKLVEVHKKHKRDPTMWQCDELLSLEYMPGVSRAGNDMVTVHVTTSGRVFKDYLLEHTDFLARKKEFWRRATNDFTAVPRSATYRKKEGGMWEVRAFNEKTDVEVLNEKLAN